MQSDKRWGGKRRPRITIPKAVTRTDTKRLFKVFYFNTAAQKDYYMNVAADSAGEAERLVITPCNRRVLRRIERTDGVITFDYPTYDVQYRGEHQDLLRAK